MKGNGGGGRERERALGSSGRRLTEGVCDPHTWMGFQLLRSSSVAVSTSQDLDDKAAITAFCTQGGTADLRCCNPHYFYTNGRKIDDGIYTDFAFSAANLDHSCASN